MAKKLKQGGKRSNAGRKPVADKAVQVIVYPRKSKVDALGGMDAAKTKIMTEIFPD